MPVVFDPDGCLVEPIDPIVGDAPGWATPEPFDPLPAPDPIYDFPPVGVDPPTTGACGAVAATARVVEGPPGSGLSVEAVVLPDADGCGVTVEFVVTVASDYAGTAGAAGPPGDRGPTGPAGLQGPDGFCLDCSEPPVSSSASLGSSSAGSFSYSSAVGGPALPITCAECPDTSLPATVTATVIGTVGVCVLPAPLTMTRSGVPGNYLWTSNSFMGGGAMVAVRLQCASGSWRMDAQTGPGGCTLGLPWIGSGTCSPLAMSFTLPACFFCVGASPGETVTVVVTP